jgi:hypothetical protein
VAAFDPKDAEAVRRRRATANRVLTYLKAALNQAWRNGVTTPRGGGSSRSSRSMRLSSAICHRTRSRGCSMPAAAASAIS